MDLIQLLREDLIIVGASFQSKEAVIQFLSSLLYKKGYVKKDFAQSVLAREEQFPTGLPTEGVKVALPHTDTEHVIQSSIAIATLREPVEFHVMGSPNETVMVNIVFLLAIREKEEVVNVLSQLVTAFQDSVRLKAVSEADNAKKVLHALQRENSECFIRA